MISNNGLWFLDAQVKIHLAQADNADGLSVVEHIMGGGFAPPLHVHHEEDETFYILEGRFCFEREGERAHAKPGDTVHIPRGVRHGFRVESPEGGRCLTVTRSGFEQAIRDVARPALIDGIPEPIKPTPAMLADLGPRFTRHGIDLVGPPIA